MTAEMGNGSLWGHGQGLDADTGVWGWIHMHRAYCTAVLAVVVATLYGAHWAGQPSGEMGTMSSSSSVSVATPMPSD